MKKGMTTIKISRDSVRGLSELKIHPRQSYEEVILKLLGSAKAVSGVSGAGGVTTIKISKATVQKLSELKIHPRQSYEEVIVGLLKNG